MEGFGEADRGGVASESVAVGGGGGDGEVGAVTIERARSGALCKQWIHQEKMEGCHIRSLQSEKIGFKEVRDESFQRTSRF